MSKRFVVHYPDVIKEVFQDPKLSLKAKALYGIMVYFYYGAEITFANIQSKCFDSKHVIKSALKELEICGFIGGD